MAIGDHKKRNMASQVLLGSMLIFLAFFQCKTEVSPNHKLEIQSACELAQDPEVCHSTLVQNINSIAPKDLSETALRKSLTHVQQATDLIPPSWWLSSKLEPEQSRAFEDCRLLQNLTLQHLTESLSNLNNFHSAKWEREQVADVQSLLSAALTNHYTCLRRLEETNVKLRQFPFTDHMHNASRSVNTILVLIKKFWIASKNVDPQRRSGSNSVSNITGLHSKHKYGDHDFQSHYGTLKDGFPGWLSREDRRRLLQRKIVPHVVVAKDGSSRYTTIAQGINAAPSNSPTKFVVHVKKGVYNENILVPGSKTNIMLMGDGKDVTVITGSRGVGDKWLMNETATFIVFGNGFVARDITFENTAGPLKHQAIALTVVSDKSVFYRCALKGYQDTLFAYSMRQFYRECDIYGTVDFICGNAAAVFQNCNILVRKPIPGQQNVVTAHNRVLPDQPTGFSLQNCRVIATPELAPVVGSVKTYLGRPWGKSSCTVFISCYLDNLIDPAGWLEWQGQPTSETLYYGEYKNSGPGARTARRVGWPGYRVMSKTDADKFTVSNFIAGQTWLPSEGIPFD